MKIEVRDDKVIIQGYVNAVERKSKTLTGRDGKFVEMIMPNAFQRAIDNNDDIKVLLNHDSSKVLADTKDGTAELKEDNIGLRAKVEITDKDVIEKAKSNRLSGWSFGFYDKNVERVLDEGMPLRKVRDMELVEVSILDDTRTPAYNGTSIETRDDNNLNIRNTLEEISERNDEDKINEIADRMADIVVKKLADTSKKEAKADYSDYENRLNKIRR